MHDNSELMDQIKVSMIWTLGLSVIFWFLVPNARPVWQLSNALALGSLPGLTMSSGSAFYVSEASEDHAGTVYGTPGNLAPGQCIIDGARAFGSASAVSESVLNGTAVKVTSLDADGGIVGDSAYVAFEKTYTYNTQTGQMTGLLMSAGVLLALLLVVSAIARVIR